MGSCLDQDQNTIDCGDPNCTYGDCITVGAAGATVTANPMVSPSASTSSANDLMQMGNTMAQWGTTIAAIATHTPAVIGPTGARVGTPAVAPVTSMVSGSNGMLLLLLVGAVVLVLVMRK